MSAPTLQKTTRREAREKYVRYILDKAGIVSDDAETFLAAKQAALENFSPLELIYSGEYTRGVAAVERFVDAHSEEI